MLLVMLDPAVPAMFLVMFASVLFPVNKLPYNITSAPTRTLPVCAMLTFGLGYKDILLTMIDVAVGVRLLASVSCKGSRGSNSGT